MTPSETKRKAADLPDNDSKQKQRRRETMANENTTTTLDPEGDIILEISSSQDEEKTSLLVSSKVLSLASPVFAKMLGPNFEEGSRKASASAPAIVRLPEDNAAAMDILCRAIHYQIDDFSEPVTSTELKNLAVLCDKYDCVRALKPWTTLWFTAALEDYPSKDSCVKLLVAACALDDPHAFSIISWEIIVTRQGPISGLQQLTEHDLMPKTVLAEMEHRRSEMYLNMSDAIEKPIEELLNLSHEVSCPSIARFITQYLNEVRRRRIWPLAMMMQHFSASEICSHLQSVQTPTLVDCCHRGCHQCRKPDIINAAANVKDRLRAAGKKIWGDDKVNRMGLCLDCVKSGRLSRSEGSCRIDHI